MSGVQHTLDSIDITRTQHTDPEYQNISVDVLVASQYHHRNSVQPPEALKRSINRLGVITPLICHREQNEITVLDGMKRVNVAKELNIETVPVIIYENMDPTKQLELSVVLNTIPNNSDIESEKCVVEQVIDSYDHLQQTDYHNVAYAIGFESKFDRLMVAFDDVDYISSDDIYSLIEQVPHIADITYFSYEQYLSVDGIGESKAQSMATVDVDIKHENDVFDPDSYSTTKQRGIDEF